MDTPACHECGATWTRLGSDGCCAGRGGCEHRIQRAEAIEAASNAAFQADYDFHFVPLPCGHTQAEHVEQWKQIGRAPGMPFGPSAFLQQFIEGGSGLTGYGWDDGIVGYTQDDEPG